MPNVSNKAYGLTTLIPIKNGSVNNTAYSSRILDRLQDLPLNENSPMAKVPNTYLARFYVLNDVIYQEGEPANKSWGFFETCFNWLFYGKISVKEDHLKSKYLVFSSNFYGDLDVYLEGMWKAAADELKPIFEHCVAFERVTNESSFVDYIKDCQVETTFFFNGSVSPLTDENGHRYEDDRKYEEEDDVPLVVQLKSLYLKQEFSKFVYAHQGKSDEELQKSFEAFIKEVQPNELSGPTWKAGAATLENAEITSNNG